MLCWLAGREIAIDEDELNGAVRRAELLLAAGGDPHRPLDPFGRAATALADDLDTPERRATLMAGLAALRDDVAGLRGARESLALLLVRPRARLERLRAPRRVLAERARGGVKRAAQPARRAMSFSGPRARPRASAGWATSPHSRPATTGKTPGARAAANTARGCRSKARFAAHDAAAWRSSVEASAAV